jgi:uncharacterized protein (TIGR02118 family)
MIRLTVMYPDAEDAYFDMEYYLNTHMALVREKCGDALKDCTVEQGLGGAAPGSRAPYRVTCRLSLDSMDDFLSDFAPHDPVFAADIPNFTNIKPVIQINEVVL